MLYQSTARPTQTPQRDILPSPPIPPQVNLATATSATMRAATFAKFGVGQARLPKALRAKTVGRSGQVRAGRGPHSHT